MTKRDGSPPNPEREARTKHGAPPQAAAAATPSPSRQYSFLALLPIAALVIDAKNFQVLGCNPSARQLLQTDDGKEMASWLRGQDRAKILEWLGKLDKGDHGLTVLTETQRGVPIEMVAKRLEGAAAECLLLVRDCGEQREAEQTLRLSEERFRRAYERNLAGIYRTTMDGRILDCNPAMARMFGYASREEMMRAKAEDFYFNPADRKKVIDDACDLKPRSFEMLLKKKDGTPLWVLENMSVVEERPGAEPVLYGTVIDITERKLAEQMLRASEAHNRELIENANDIIYTHDLSGHFTWANDAAMKLMGYTLDEVRGKNLKDIVAPEFLQVAIDQTAQKLRGEAANTPYELEAFTKSGDRLAIEVNTRLMWRDGVPVGVQGIARDITARRRAEKALRESENKFRVMAETAPCGIFIYHQDTFLYVNPATELITGYSRDELLQMKFWELVHPDHREMVKQRGLARLRGEKISPRYEFKIQRKNGEERWMDFTAGAVEYGGGPAALGTGFDVTERKRTEEALIVQQAYLEQLFETAPEGIIVLDQKDCVVRANAEFLRMFGYEQAEVTGRPINSLIIPPGKEKEGIEFSTRAARGEPVEFESTRRRKDGSLVEVASVGTPITVHGGQIARFAIYRDITERRHAEENLLVQKAYLEQLFDSAPEGIVVLDQNDAIVRVNHEFVRMFGYTAEECVGKHIDELIVPEANRQAARQLSARCIGGEVVTSEATRVRKDGTLVECSILGTPISVHGGQIATYAIYRDVTERKRAEGAVRQAELRYRSIFENAAEGIFQTTLDGKWLTVNPAMARIFGHSSPDELMRKLDLRKGYYADPRRREQFIEDVLHKETVTAFESEVRRNDGARIWISENVRCVRDGSGKLVGFEGLVQDITERKKAEQALKESEAKFRAVAETAASAIYIFSGEKFLFANRACELITGYTREELLSLDAWQLAHPDYRQVIQQRAQARLRGEEVTSRYEGRILTKSGEDRWLDFSAGVIQFGGHNATLVTALDITERKRAERLQAALYLIAETATSAEDLEDLYAAIHNIVGEMLYARNFYIALLDPDGATMRFVHAVDEVDTFEPPGTPVPLGKGCTEYVLRTGQPQLITEERFRELCAAGETVEIGAPSIDWLGVPLKTGNRVFGALVVQSYNPKIRFHERDKEILTFVSQHVATAIERKRNMDALRESEARYRSLVDSAVYGIFRSTPEGRFSSVNPALVKMLGYASAEEVMALDLNRDVYADAEERDRIIEGFYHVGAITTTETRWKRNDGTPITVRLSGRQAADASGKIEGFEMIAEDVTERRALEDQLRQSQKMEAVGRLAGGLAHDFNNLLTVIKGYSELMANDLEEADPMRAEVVEIHRAAERAASLTRQLLAFSRQQVLAPRVLDLNHVLSNMDKLLRRLLGEDVELFTALDPTVGRVKADPGQVEQVIMNLAVNARDAMPNGGKLTIETSNARLDEAYARDHVGVKPGSFVMIAVTDTGEGMPPEVQSRIFEPFFTTKELGKGTGLGLSTVYGIVKQSEGYIWVYSEPGKGTTFKVYLPRVDAQADLTTTGKMPAYAHFRGTETVLLVEDEDGVRALIRQVLHKNGYTVLEARHGGEALLICERHPTTIDLLLTDVVLEQMSGHELAKRLAQERPEMKVLFMSGYTDEAIVRHGVLEPNTAFLQKPFTTDALARKVRAVLDGEEE